MRILSRAEWGATVATAPYLMRLPAVGVHVHHSVTLADDDHDLESTGDVAADMREIEAIGKTRFGRFPYSYAIHPSGVIGEGAGLTVGAHTEGWNSTTFGIVLIGNYENDAPTDAQVEAFGDLFRHLVANGWLSPSAWMAPHRLRKATACPGARTMARWADLVAAVNPPPPPDLEELLMSTSAFQLVGSDGHVRLFVPGQRSVSLGGLGGPHERLAHNAVAPLLAPPVPAHELNEFAARWDASVG